LAGLIALVTKRIESSDHSTMSIFSPRSSRMIDCTRVPFMPTQAPTGIDVALARVDRDLGAVARLAHGAADDDGAVVDLRHFLLEELDEQGRVGPRQDDLRAPWRRGSRRGSPARTRSPTA
jgi:hypothetical protein